MSKESSAKKNIQLATSAPDPRILEKVQSFALFRDTTDDFVRFMASIAQVVRVEPGHRIVKEGESNRLLYILSSGDVEVLVEGERVAMLGRPGDLMGEISTLTSRPVTASLIALTEVEFLAIDIKDLETRVLSQKEDFGFFLYRTLSGVLSEKIINTNQKARRFEMANRALEQAMRDLEDANRSLDLKVQERTLALQMKTQELLGSNLALEQRNTELVASHRKLEELSSSKELTFKRLNDLQVHYLKPLLETLKELESDAEEATRSSIHGAVAQLESSIEMLRPLNELYSNELAIRSRRVLLIEQDKKQQVISKLALGGTGVRLDIAATQEDALEVIRSGEQFDLVFVTSEMAHVIPEIHQHLPRAKMVFMASSNVAAELPAMKQHGHLLPNIVSRNPQDRTFTIKNVATTVSKLISKDLFGLEKYLNWGVEVQSRKVTNSGERGDLIQQMRDYFKGLGVRNSISERAGIVAEELLMNAIYDAPVDKDGKALYNHLPRTTAVELAAEDQAQFRFACDGMLAAISVTDPFGAFRIKILLDYLERNYAQGAAVAQDAGKGGAGRGLHQIVECSDLVVFNVQRGVRTEVVALFNLDISAGAEGAGPSFHFFFE